jgi:hypothetical protein
MDWILLGALVVATAAIIAHNEWRYRNLVEWVDAIGEMVGEYIELHKHKI